MSSTRTQQPVTEPMTPDPNRDEKRWYAQPLLWVAVALVTVTAVVIAAMLINRAEEPAAQLPTTPPVDTAAQERAAQDAYQGYVDAETAAYEALDVGPLVGLASSDVIDPLREQFANFRYAEITAAGTTTATTEVIDYQADAPGEGWTSVILDVCTDTSASTVTLPDGSDARRNADGGTDYLTRTQATVTMANNTAAGAERWVVQSFESDYATPC